MRTIADAMEKTYRGMLSKIDSNSRNSRKIIFIPVKNQNLQKLMSHCRLTNLFRLYVHSFKADTLDLLTVAKEFVCVNSRRMTYFANFNSL